MRRHPARGSAPADTPADTPMGSSAGGAPARSTSAVAGRRLACCPLACLPARDGLLVDGGRACSPPPGRARTAPPSCPGSCSSRGRCGLRALHRRAAVRAPEPPARAERRRDDEPRVRDGVRRAVRATVRGRRRAAAARRRPVRRAGVQPLGDRRAAGGATTSSSRSSATATGGRSAIPRPASETANELHIPRRAAGGRCGWSARTVNHSFWVPELSGKRDLIPGHTNTLTLLAEEPGDYRGACAEFCRHPAREHVLPGDRACSPTRSRTGSRGPPPPAAEPDTASEQRGREAFLALSCAGCQRRSTARRRTRRSART